LIETGTGPGEGVRRALAADVPVIHSIEINDTLHGQACAKFQGHPNLHIYLGSSPDVLKEIITPKPGTVFFLDAHYSGGLWSDVLDPRYGQCHLLAELAVIRSFSWPEPPLIIIDDAGQFNPERTRTNGRYDWAQWPTVADIEQACAPWPVWLYGVDSQHADDDCQLVTGRARESMAWLDEDETK
jgi:hypothetical protein